jgi:hypothetical protein
MPPLALLDSYCRARRKNTNALIAQGPQNENNTWMHCPRRSRNDRVLRADARGPKGFFSQNKIAFAKGDQIEVTGSKVKFANTDALLAREITKGEQKLTLRNERSSTSTGDRT